MDAALKRLLPSEAEVAIDLYKAHVGGDGWIYRANGRRWRRIKWPEPALVTKAIETLRTQPHTRATIEEPEWGNALQAADEYLVLVSVMRRYYQRETSHGAPLRTAIGTALMKALPEVPPERRDKVADALVEIVGT